MVYQKLSRDLPETITWFTRRNRVIYQKPSGDLLETIKWFTRRTSYLRKMTAPRRHAPKTRLHRVDVTTTVVRGLVSDNKNNTVCKGRPKLHMKIRKSQFGNVQCLPLSVSVLLRPIRGSELLRIKPKTYQTQQKATIIFNKLATSEKKILIYFFISLFRRRTMAHEPLTTAVAVNSTPLLHTRTPTPLLRHEHMTVFQQNADGLRFPLGLARFASQ